MGESVAVMQVMERDTFAKEIGEMWVKWSMAKKDWLDEKKELRAYLFATDTRKTSNNKLPWKNSTVTPKLTQIRDNLHANYLAALFPNENWFVWEGADQDSVSKQKRLTIQEYMKNKLKASGFELIVSKMILDYIDYGNVIAGHQYVTEFKTNEDGTQDTKYIGPKAFRVSPLDVVIDITADSFENSPMIHRVVKSFGDLERDLQDKPELHYDISKIYKARDYRRNLKDYVDEIKQAGFTVDGFTTLEDYFQSNNVELLHFYGDFYDMSTGTLHKDQIITVMDRCHIIRMETNPSWFGSKPFKHCGWRVRPDNLWAQGPLDQLVGMQYRIDHLENLKADVFDQIAHPISKIIGSTVDEFEFQPGVKIYVGDEGDVEFMRPEAQALNADMQIDILMQRMEEMAGAPKQAMGIRTPGEKTKYEVQVLENGAGRIFQSKVNWIEKNLIEPLLNSMLEQARRNLKDTDSVAMKDPDTGAVEFKTITKQDITAKGKLYPIGARHFAEKAKFVQEMTQTLTLIQQMPTVTPHISGLAVATALEDAFGWQAYKIVSPNIAISEQSQTQQAMNAAQERIAINDATPVEPQPGDIPSDIPTQ